MTQFQATRIFEDLLPEYAGIPILVPTKITGNFPSKSFATKIHRESHSHINVDTITVPHNLVFFTQFFS